MHQQRHSLKINIFWAHYFHASFSKHGFYLPTNFSQNFSIKCIAILQEDFVSLYILNVYKVALVVEVIDCQDLGNLSWFMRLIKIYNRFYLTSMFQTSYSRPSVNSNLILILWAWKWNQKSKSWWYYSNYLVKSASNQMYFPW